MSHRIAIAAVGVAILALSALPRPAAAQVYDDGGRGPFMLHAEEDIRIDADGARVIHGETLRGGSRRDDGPVVVYDEASPDRHREGWRERGDAPIYGVPRPAYDDGSRGVYGGRPYGVPAYAAPYRGVSAPIDYEPVGERSFAPDSGCVTEQSRSTTAAGWQKIVTHRTCYRR